MTMTASQQGKRKTSEQNQMMLTLGASMRRRVKNTIPGPGEYDAEKALGSTRARPQTAKINPGKSRFEGENKQLEKNPGVGSYSNADKMVNKPRTTGGTIDKTMRRSKFEETKDQDIPDGGLYVQKTTFELNSSKTHTMGLPFK